MLGLYHLINRSALREFLLSCQSPVNAFISHLLFYLFPEAIFRITRECNIWFHYFVFQYGGFTKFQYEVIPDLYHSYYGFAALTLLEEKELDPLCVELGLAVFNKL
jgi:geranylgeranyl transferase type-1 subunit beta